MRSKFGKRRVNNAYKAVSVRNGGIYRYGYALFWRQLDSGRMRSWYTTDRALANGMWRQIKGRVFGRVQVWHDGKLLRGPNYL